MDVGTSFGYVFQDPAWVKKVAIGGIIWLGGFLLIWLLGIPIILAGILSLGYILTVIRNVAEGSALPLPEWGDIGGLFMKGLYAGIGVFVLYLPVVILAVCNLALGLATGAASDQSGQAAAEGTAALLGIVYMCLNCISALYSFAMGIYIYAPLTRYALNNQMNVFWDFQGNWAFINSNLGNYIIAWVITIIAGFVGSLGFLLCLIGLPFTLFYGQLVTAHIFGQFARGRSASMTPAAPAAM